MKKIVVVLALLMAVMLSSCVHPEESGVKVIVGARLGSLDYSVVVIENGKFRAVGSQAATPVPIGAETIRGTGLTIRPIPGGTPIEPGQPADLLLEGPTPRTMRQGAWVK